MKRSDILTPIGMLLGIGLIVFAISQGNVGLAGFYDLVSVIITIGGSYAALLITFSLDEVKMMGTISKGLFKTPSMNKIDVINQFKEISIKSRKDGLLALESDIEQIKDSKTRNIYNENSYRIFLNTTKRNKRWNSKQTDWLAQIYQSV